MPRAIRQDVFRRTPAVWAGLALASLVALTIAPAGRPRAPEEAGAVTLASRAITVADRDDGAVVIRDAADGRVVLVLPPGQDGFMRGTLRGLARDRRLRNLGPEAPFRLTAWSDGRMTLDDMATGRRLDLLAFGQTNAEAFLRLLPNGENTK
jgi:putative photosynthetic complex assembly protein